MTNIFELKDEAETEAYVYFDSHIRKLTTNSKGEINRSAPGLVDNDVDAFRHAYTSGIFTQAYNAHTANILGICWEGSGGNSGGSGGGSSGKNMDLWNNAVGRKYGGKTRSKDELAKYIQKALENGELIIDPDDSRQYQGETGFIVDPEKPVIVVNENASGRNELFIDLIKWESFDRASFVLMIKAGGYPGYRIASIDEIATPMSKPDGNRGNNLG